MTDDAFVMNMPTGMGGRGKKEIRAFYRDSFVNSLPDDIAGELRHRVVGEPPKNLLGSRPGAPASWFTGSGGELRKSRTLNRKPTSHCVPED